jgi:molecular chaperone GrpE
MTNTPFQNNPNTDSDKVTPQNPQDSEAPEPTSHDSQPEAAHQTEAERQNDQEGDLQIALITMQTELHAMTETAKRAMADLQNVRRHHEEEKTRLNIYANIKLLEAIFPAIDNFNRAIETQPKSPAPTEWEACLQGLLATGQLLIKALEQLGLEVIDQIHVPVDPFRHEVLIQGEGPAGEVLQVFEKGYLFKGEVIRPAKVMVGKTA